MPASLFGERFLGRKPAWHRLGTVMDSQGMSATEAMRIADIGFPITKVPTYAELPNGDLIQTNQYAVVREPTSDDPEHRILSSVGSEWTALQASDLADMLDPITKEYPVETAGALGNGEKIFFSLDAGSGVIAGEDHQLYYLVTDHRDGTGALTVAFTPVRVVCQNTLTVGLSNARVSVSLHHNKQIKVDAQWYMSIFHNMMQSKDTVIATMNQLAEVTVNDAEAKSIITAGHPDPSQNRRIKLAKDITPDDVDARVWSQILNDKKHYLEIYEKSKERVEVIRNAVWERYQIFNEEQPRLAKTPWAVWQAVVETEDYRRGKGVEGGESDKAILYGNRAEAKAKSFARALELSKR